MGWGESRLPYGFMDTMWEEVLFTLGRNQSPGFPLGLFWLSQQQGCLRKEGDLLEPLKSFGWVGEVRILEWVAIPFSRRSSRWIMEKGKEFQKNIYFCFIDYAKAFDYVDHNKLSKILKGMGMPDHLACFLRGLYAGQEAIVRTVDGTNDWFRIGKWVRQG